MEKTVNIRQSYLRGIGSLPLKVSLGQHVYEHLKRAILDGSIPPGNRVVESRIADALDISRTPVREAIHKLEKEGLLSKYPTGGLFVAGLTRRDIEETFGIRGVLESYAARLAAINHMERDIVELEEKINEYQICLDKGDLVSLPRVNTEFHDMIYALSQSPKLIGMINNLRDQIFRFRKVILKEESRAQTSNEDHRLIVSFIKRRDSEGVERLVREHILRGKELVMNEYDFEKPSPGGEQEVQHREDDSGGSKLNRSSGENQR